MQAHQIRIGTRGSALPLAQAHEVRARLVAAHGWPEEAVEIKVYKTTGDVVLDLGWGRLVFGHTFGDLRGVLDALRAEESGRRDICIYPRDPQVLIGLAPDELFLDPSLTLRALPSSLDPRRRGAGHRPEGSSCAYAH